MGIEDSALDDRGAVSGQLNGAVVEPDPPRQPTVEEDILHHDLLAAAPGSDRLEVDLGQDFLEDPLEKPALAFLAEP